MKKIIFILTASLWLVAAQAHSATTYTYTLSGLLSGNHNETAFENKAFTMTISAPDTSIGLPWFVGNIYVVGSYNSSEASDITLTVADVGTAIFSAPNTGFFNNLTNSIAGFNTSDDLCGFYAAEFATYQLGDLAPTPVVVSFYPNISNGTDDWSSLVYSEAVFQTTSVPEPSTLAILGIGSLALAARRRKQAA